MRKFKQVKRKEIVYSIDECKVIEERALCVIIDVSEVKKNLWYNRNTYNH